MDGWEFRRRQRQDPTLAPIPVVVTTGIPDRDLDASTLDADGYLTKPYNVGALFATMARYCPPSR
jgi:CheY-like chemotaxis protein